MGEEGWAKEDLHQRWIRNEEGIYIGGGVRLPEHKQHSFICAVLAFYAPRTQQALLFFVFWKHKQQGNNCDNKVFGILGPRKA